MWTEKKRQKAVRDIINEMFKIAGHQVTYDDIVDRKDDWYCQWSMTEKQYADWQEWGIKYLQKMRFTKKTAQVEMGFIGINWGLTFKKESNDTSSTLSQGEI